MLGVDIVFTSSRRVMAWGELASSRLRRHRAGPLISHPEFSLRRESFNSSRAGGSVGAAQLALGPASFD
jgi:hypothetical protein